MAEKNDNFSRKALVRILLVMLIAFLAITGGVYWLIGAVTRHLMAQKGPEAAISLVASWISVARQVFWPFFVPAVALFFLLLALLLWASLRRAHRKQAEAAAAAAPARRPPAEARQRKAEEARETLEQNKRIFLHIFSMLQKEGRLMDFFSENLAQYADGQIGAAVRNIHENCKNAIDKYLAPTAVLEQNEGQEITVDTDFDPNALKLIGNVTGQPPFKGIVRHRGWRARKIDLPTLSGSQDPSIIAPAEVEVV